MAHFIYITKKKVIFFIKSLDFLSKGIYILYNKPKRYTNGQFK